MITDMYLHLIIRFRTIHYSIIYNNNNNNTKKLSFLNNQKRKKGYFKNLFLLNSKESLSIVKKIVIIQ